jgi:adenylate cyclase
MWRRRPVPRAALTLAVGLLAAGIALAVGATGVLDELELKTVDKRFEVRGAQAEPNNVVVVGLDDNDLRRVHSQVLPRSLHARVIDNLLRAGARVIAYDIEFSDPSLPHEDAVLLNAAKRAGPRLVLATTRIVRGQPAVLDGADLRAHGVRFANPDFHLDKDGAIRRVTGRVHGIPQFAAVAATAASSRAIHPRPLRGKGAWIDFWAPPDQMTIIPFADVLSGQVDPNDVRGKLVIVGSTATVLQDFHQTSEPGAMSGPQVQQAAAHTILAGFPLSDPPGWLEPLMAIVAGLLAPAATLRGRPGREIVRALAAAALGLIALVVGTQLAFNGGAVISLLVPLLALVLGTAGAIALAYAIEIRARRQMRSTFERFVPKEVVGELLARGGASPRLPGERVEATVLFCDLRGFTTLAETLEGERVIDVLDRWFNEMGDAVLDHGGTLVSFQGDGIMSVFGAPLRMPDHATRALAAAREMLDVRLPRINGWLTEQGLIDEPARMGIGINTGTIMSGSVGSDRRLEYAAVGDATNTAARLQALSKRSEHQLFIAQSTHDALNDANGLVLLGPMDLPGRREPCVVWTLPDDRRPTPDA